MANNVAYFCSRCGERSQSTDRACRCCGAEPVDVSSIIILKRVSSRRSRTTKDDEPEDTGFPF